MKNLKSKSRFLTKIICLSLLMFVNISCETEENYDLDEVLEFEEKMEVSSKRGCCPRRSMKTVMVLTFRNYYRATVSIKNDNENIINTIALELESKEGILKESKTYNLKYFTTIKNRRYFTLDGIKLDGKELDNQEITTNITFLDADKKPMGESVEDVIVLKKRHKSYLRNLEIKRGQNNINRFRLKANIESDNPDNPDNDVTDVEITVNDLQGNIINFTTKPKKNNTVNANFSFEKETDSKKMSVVYTLKNFYGDVINTFKEEVTLESNIKIGKVTFNENSKGLYTTLVTIKNGLENDIEKISLTIEKEEGIAEKTITYDLKYVDTKKGRKYYSTENVALIDSKIKEIPVTVTIYAKSYTEIVVMRAPRYRGDRG